MRIGTRLALSFTAAMLAGLFCLAAVGISVINLSNIIRQIKEEALPFVMTVDEMDISVQKTAEETSGQAEELATIVSYFRVRESKK